METDYLLDKLLGAVIEGTQGDKIARLVRAKQREVVQCSVLGRRDEARDSDASIVLELSPLPGNLSGDGTSLLGRRSFADEIRHALDYTDVLDENYRCACGVADAVHTKHCSIAAPPRVLFVMRKALTQSNDPRVERWDDVPDSVDVPTTGSYRLQ
eukprot:TRINITY_DN9002_c0_g1_i1.p2 TRINITY_DN9002_c0_g1~~TRINITY_DN9002_c0_g1_i1.p2  ORF type:complete len:156 (-),score=44.32 TRINITY_DN9002_c0_g1_i1:254-721(-)